MQWLENIRNKPHESKVRMIWIAAGVAVAILIALWVLVGRMTLNPNESFIGTMVDRIGHPGKTFPKLFNRE